MAIDVAKLNAIANSVGGRQSRGFGGNDQMLASIVRGATARRNADLLPTDSFEIAKSKLQKSIDAINASNAPDGLKGAASSKAVGSKHDETVFDRLINTLTKPKTAVVAGIARAIDPNRNFMKDLRNNVGTGDVLAGADWYKGLPSFAKIGVNLVGDIALDPLTYLAPSALIGKAGGATGLADKAASAATKATRAAGEASEAAVAAQHLSNAEKLTEIAGKLSMKGQGGIGGMTDDSLKWLGNTLKDYGDATKGIENLKGGLYWNVPGTGRVAQTVSGWAGINHPGVTQAFLGRPDWMRKLSAGADNALKGVKTAKVAASLGDQFGGGEGAWKRIIMNSETPQQAMQNRQILNAVRTSDNSSLALADIFAKEAGGILQDAKAKGIDLELMTHALGDNRAAIAAIDAIDPEMVGRIQNLRSNYLKNAEEQGRRTLRALGIDENLMDSLVANERIDQQGSVLTDEAMAKALDGFNPEQGNLVGPERRANIVGGNDMKVPVRDASGQPVLDAAGKQVYESRVLADPNDPMFRVIHTDPKTGEVTVLGKGFSEEEAILDIQGKEIGNPDPFFRGNATKDKRPSVRANIDGELKNYEMFGPDGNPAVTVQRIEPDEFGRSVREQANAHAKEAYDHEIFVNKWDEAQQKLINDYTEIYRRQLRGAILKHHGLARDLELPPFAAKAQAKIDKAMRRVAEVADKKVASGEVAAVAATEQARAAYRNFAEMSDNIAQLEAELKLAAKGSRTARQIERKLVEAQAEMAAQADALSKLVGSVERGEAKLEDLQRALDEIGPAPEQVAAQELPVASEMAPTAPVADVAAAAPMAPVDMAKYQELQFAVEDAQRGLADAKAVGSKAGIAEETKKLTKAEKALVKFEASMPAPAAPAETATAGASAFADIPPQELYAFADLPPSTSFKGALNVDNAKEELQAISEVLASGDKTFIGRLASNLQSEFHSLSMVDDDIEVLRQAIPKLEARIHILENDPVFLAKRGLDVPEAPLTQVADEAVPPMGASPEVAPEDLQATLFSLRNQLEAMQSFDPQAAISSYTQELQGLYRDAKALIPDYMGSAEDTKVLLDSLISEGYLTKMPKSKTAEGIAAELDRNLAAELKTAADDALVPHQMRVEEIKQQIAEYEAALGDAGGLPPAAVMEPDVVPPPEVVTDPVAAPVDAPVVPEPVAPVAVAGTSEAHVALADAAGVAQQRLVELEAQIAAAGAGTSQVDAAASKAMARRSEKAWRTVAEEEGIPLTADSSPDFSKMKSSGDFANEAEVREAFPEYDAFATAREQSQVLQTSGDVQSAQSLAREAYSQKEIIRANEYVNANGIEDPFDVQRLSDAASSGKLDTVIKNIEAEAKLAAAEQKELAKSVAAVTDTDAMAASAVRHNIEEPAVVEQVVKDTVEKQKHAEVLGPAVPDDIPTPEVTQQVLVQHFDELAAERAELERQITNQTRSNKGLNTKMQNRIDEIDRLQGHLSDGMERIDQLDADYQALRQPFIDDAQAILDDSTRAALEENRNLRQTLAIALDADAKRAKQLGKAVDNAEWTAFMRTPQAEWAWNTVSTQGFTKISRTAQAPGHVAEGIEMLTKMTTRGELPKFMKYFDQLTQLFKAWAITSPAFSIRNGLSDAFMNYHFGVAPGSYRNYIKASRAFDAAIAAGKTIDEAFLAVPKDLQEAYQLVWNSGVLNGGGQISNEISTFRDLLGNKEPRNIIERLSDTKLNRLSYQLGSWENDITRGAAAMHAASSGRGVEGIYDLVFKAHFDYSDLNNFEKQVMRRVSPFYTWFRKALPTMMEGVIRNPKSFARYGEFKNAIESVSAPEDLMPEWLSDSLAIRLPFGLPGGQNYLIPDLPFATLNTISNPIKGLTGQINPLIKTPIEMQMDNKLFFGKSAPFQGLVQMPGYLQPLSPLLGAIGLVKQDAEGQPMMQDKTLYALEQFFPLLGRARRMLPNEPRYQDRLPVTWANFLFGASMRVNTKSDMTGELYARQKTVDAIAEQLNDLGYGGYEYWKKQVGTAYKPTDTDRRPYLTLIQPKGGLGADSPFTSLPTRKSAADVLSEALASNRLQSVVAASAAARSLSNQ